MKKLLLFIVLIANTLSVQAQDVFMKGDNLIGAKIGIGNGLATSTTYENCIVDGLFRNGNGAIGIDRLDTYAGAMLGYEIVNTKNYGRSNDPNFDYSHFINVDGSGMTFSLHLGARYYLTDNLAANIELGYGVAFANLGLSYRF